MLFTTHKLHGDTKGKDGQQRVHNNNNNMNNNNISQKAARKTIKKLFLFFLQSTPQSVCWWSRTLVLTGRV